MNLILPKKLKKIKLKNYNKNKKIP